MNYNLLSILRKFNIEGNIQSAKPFGSGHINDSFKVEAGEKKYLLQRINHKVFKDIEGLTYNIVNVTDHIRNKINSFQNDDPLRKTLRLIKSLNGKYFVTDDDGNFWRLFDFIEEGRSYDLVENSGIAYEGGKAYGRFINLLSDFPAKILVETIPDFHNIEFRLNNFWKAIKLDQTNRVKNVADEIKFIKERANEMKLVLKLGKEGKIPLRVTHNDTKINNVLFNKDGKAICVIDLDTVMPGYVHYDFGDSIRTFANTADEDESDLSKVNINLDYFTAFAKGFLKETKLNLNTTEIETLAFSAKLMTFIIGLRFLTDYIYGDKYYKIKYPGHNLQRARVQFKLLESLEEKYIEMQRIILQI
ncbi:MAG: aminoglycoside phosphotransferase family protein [Bacteroidetes bacterium]|nr:aminoglycoside phosphotransferase family protein [Bacteroidota bacterium]MBL7104738.1 aminoglycoside phosphotransferase family protein [Bacteroidales bacterium]